MAEKVKKLVLEKFSIKRGPAIQRFPFEEGDIKIIKYYSGETLKGKPNGKGIFEVYTIDVSFAKFYKSKKFDSLWKKYSKNFLDKSRGYVLSERHVGNWKLGKKEGKGEKTEYIGVSDSDHDDMFVNKDGSPIIMNKKIGNYKNDKEQGKFQIFDMNFGWATLNYKNGKVIGNPVKMNKKNNLNNHETLQINFPSPWDKHVISILKNR